MNPERDAPYRRVLHALLAGIRAGELSPGARIPSEEAIADQHGVSRATVSRVMQDLRLFGVITGPPGGNAIVARQPMLKEALSLYDAAADLRERNRQPPDRGTSDG
jgi:DNA-binding GntR family transcriptional regulator